MTPQALLLQSILLVPAIFGTDADAQRVGEVFLRVNPSVASVHITALREGRVVELNAVN